MLVLLGVVLTLRTAIFRKLSRHLFQYRSSHQGWSIKKSVLGNFTKITGKHLCQSLFFNKVAGLRLRPKACYFIKKETVAQVFSCKFCEISRNTFFTAHLWTTASISKDISFPHFIYKNSIVGSNTSSCTCFVILDEMKGIC